MELWKEKSIHLELARTEQREKGFGALPCRGTVSRDGGARLQLLYLSPHPSDSISSLTPMTTNEHLQPGKGNLTSHQQATSGMQERGGRWPPGQPTRRGTEISWTDCPPTPSWVRYTEEGAGFPSPCGALPQSDQSCLGLQNYSPSDKITSLG